MLDMWCLGVILVLRVGVLVLRVDVLVLVLRSGILITSLRNWWTLKLTFSTSGWKLYIQLQLHLIACKEKTLIYSYLRAILPALRVIKRKFDSFVRKHTEALLST